MDHKKPPTSPAPPAYAHSANENGEWEPIALHLTRTAKMSAENAAAFGCETLGDTAGMLHDIGKYGDLFQRVLHHEQTHVDHAWPGASIAFSLYGGTMKDPAAILLATVIDAHHTRLCNWDESHWSKLSNATEDIYGDAGQPSLCGARALAGAIQRLQRETGFQPTPVSLVPWQQGEDINISYMLLARMLLSALVDADYSCTAEHFHPGYLDAHTGPALDASEALRRVKTLREQKQQQSRAASALNAIRDRLFDDCLRAAEAPPGLFTLTAPTGAGKTLSLFAFAARHAEKYGKRRIVLVLPYLTLAEQNVQDYRQLVPDLLESHSAAKQTERSRLLAERWSAPCIVTTTVGLFEPLFSAQPTDCRRLHQLANSVIVLDEAQSLPASLLDATLHTVQELCDHYGCTVLFSTATQPAFQYRPRLHWQPTEIVSDPQALFRATRRVTYHWRIDSPLSWDAAADELAAVPQSCAIVNLRRHARTLYERLSARADAVFCLSTDLCLAHRRAVLDEVRARLTAGLPCHLVSTQCIEAGVDISFPVLYRALAPLDAIIQAAGRCNRNGDAPDGQVTVFLPDGNEEKLYPSTHYANAANCVVKMASEGEIDCSDLAVIDRYYQMLYNGSPSDQAELTTALQKKDFDAVQQHYQLIEPGGVNVIVPYAGEAALYAELCALAHARGLCTELMTKARPLVVSSYRRADVERQCRAIPLHLPGGQQTQDTDWYILDDSSKYNETLGYIPEESLSGGIC